MQFQVRDFDRNADAADQARRWIVRIDAGDLSHGERQELKDWLAIDPAHARLLDEHALLWAAASQARFPRRVAVVNSPPSPRGWAWYGAALAAGVAAMALLVQHPADDASSYAIAQRTGVGMQHSTLLPDGSRSTLNAASSLAVSYGDKHRRITLERGVGLFEVAKDKSRPFEVLVGQTVVRAVGTRFLVQRHTSGAVEVTVYEGVVEIEKPGTEPVRLGVGQVALDHAAQTQISQASSAELDRKLAWQKGRIVFDDNSLAAALEDVNRYSTQPIELGDPALRDLRISGAFATTDVAVFLRSLEQGFGLKVRQRDGRWIISRS